jgi:hypothetical protein
MALLGPSETQRLSRLFDQQMWAFGRDATRAGGNLLIHRGFVRTAPAAGVPTSGTYRLVEEGLELELSSVGVRATCSEGTVFLDRDPMPRVLANAPPFTLARLMRWLASYETWVEQAAGDQWREASLRQRSRAPAFPSFEMASSWHGFAARLEPEHHLSA